MSVKIYSGLTAKETNVFDVADKIRAVVEPIFKRRFFEAMDTAKERVGENWNEVFTIMFKAGEKWQKPIEYHLFDTPRELYDLIVELREFPVASYSPLDFGYSILLMPNNYDRSLPPLVLAFSERAGDEYRKAMEDAGVVAEYGYWNNTDKPDSVSDEEWDIRRQAWDGWWVPRDAGLLIEMPARDHLIGEYIQRTLEPLTD